MGAVGTLVGGLAGLVAAAGIGLGVTHIVGPIPTRWRLATSLLIGVALMDWAVLLVLFLGGGIAGVKIVGGVTMAAGAALCVGLRKELHFAPGLTPTRKADGWFIAVVVLAFALNLIIAVAPSTKIDELYYHMLIPKRIVQDGGAYLYRWPFEAAIFPHDVFQLGLSPAHAAGVPEAGNVISWGIAAALIVLIAGITTDLTGSSSAGWMTGAISAVGLYSAVWHVTSGPHALGDLSTVTACMLALLPDHLTCHGHPGRGPGTGETPLPRLPPILRSASGGAVDGLPANGPVSTSLELAPSTRLFLVSLAAYAAASTKISLLPLAGVVTLIGIYRAAASLGWRNAVGIAAAMWAVFYGPIILWTTLQCGSPFGIVTATLFHSHYFGPELIARFRDMRELIQKGWMPLLRWLAPSFSIGVVAAFGIVAYAAWKRGGIFRMVAALVCGQALLIAWKLSQEFRFLGGLEYVVLVLGAWVFWTSPLGARLIARWWLVLMVACLPWVAVQVYYAGPFVAVVAGIESRTAFLREYVAFADDFRALDRILPPDALIYVVNSRLPSYYAPRPVVFTREDLRGRKILYRFSVGADAPPVESSLACGETVYKDSSAISVVYRTPGRPAERDPLTVQRCEVIAGETEKRCRVPGVRCQVSGAGCQVSGVGCQVSGAR